MGRLCVVCDLARGLDTPISTPHLENGTGGNDARSFTLSLFTILTTPYRVLIELPSTAMSDTAETGGSATMSSAVGEPTSVPASGAPSSASSDSSAPQSDSAASADVQRSTSASVSAPAASSTANKPSDAGWPFNSTVEITLNSTAPMLDFDAEGTPFKVEPDTGYRTYADSRSGAAYLRFVGMAYSLNGSAEFRPGSNPDPGLARAPASNKLYNIHRQGKDLRNITVGNNSLGEMSELNLQAYQVDLTFGAWSTISFHNATIQVPIKTQA